MLSLLALATVFASGVAAAQGATGNVHPALQDRWTFQLGAYFPSVDTTARLDSTTRARGTEVSFEDDFGFSDSETVPYFLAAVRLGERWRIEGEYFRLHRNSSRAISRTINWGDRTFAFGTNVNADFDSDIYRLSVGYSFVKNNQAELGVALGLHATDFKVSLSSANLEGQAGDALAPLPTIGVYGAYAFTPNWLLSGRLDYFSLNYGDFDGRLLNFTVGVDYRVARHFAIGAGYRHVDYELNVEKNRFRGSADYRFSGPMLYVTGSF